MYKVLVAVLLSVVLLLVACGPKTIPSPTPTSVEATPLAPKPSLPGVSAKAGWEGKWEQLVSAARLEGRVVIFNSGTFVGARQPIMRVMKEKYGVNVEMISGGSGEIAEKNLRERRAGIYSVDVQISGSTSYVRWYIPEGILEPLEPALILPEVIDPKVWLGGGLRFIDPQRQVLAFGAGESPHFFINTELVKPEELKSFRDLLNPKWKGKLAMHDPRGGGAGSKALNVIGGVLLGWEVLRELAKQEVFITRDQWLLVEWVARGKYPIALFVQQALAEELQRAGAPVKLIHIPEVSYASGSGCFLGLVNRAPHPNAAKLLINWLLTKEGQTATYQYTTVPSARLDVTTEGISPVLILDPARKYFDSDNMEFALKEPERNKEINNIFGPLFK